MLKRKFRLKNKKAFNAIYKLKNSTHKGGVSLFAGLPKSDTTQSTRVGFVVSKKTHKRAVKRNRLRRLMRESYRVLQKENSLANSQNYMSLIFIGTENALGKSFLEIKHIVSELLKRL